MKNKHYMNHNNGNHMRNGNTARLGIIAVTVITIIDLTTRRGYEVKGGGSIGTRKGKRSAWFDCKPGKGGRK